MLFRKKPIEVEAFQMTAERMENRLDWPRWLHSAWNKDPSEVGRFYSFIERGEKCYFLRTPNGGVKIDVQDWIIQGIKGEWYPCKPDIFEATYEPVLVRE